MDRLGLGYVGADTASGVQLTIDRLHETRGDLWGELTVARAPEGHLTFGRFNITSITARGTLAKSLDARSKGVAWPALLEEFCVRVLAEHRKGEPIVMVGKQPPRPEPPMVLKPLIHQGPNILFGPGGTGKSTFVAALGVSVQTGKPLFPGWDVVCPGPVYILDWESSWEDWNDTVAAIAKGMGIPPIEVVYRRCSGPLDRALYEHAAHVAATGTQLVIVDSVTWAMRSQNDGGGIDEPIKRMFDAIRQIGSNWLLIDHMNKVSSSSDELTASHAPKGGQAKTDAARSTFELREAAPPDSDGTLHLALINRKVNRTGRIQEPIGIQIRRRAGALVFETEEVQLADPVTAAATKLQDRIRAVLRTGQKMTSEEIAGELGLRGTDPAATARVTMARYPKTFAKVPKTSPQQWYLVDFNHSEPSAKHVSETVSQGRPTPKHPPYGGVYRGVSDRLPTSVVSEEEGSWASLIRSNETRQFDPEMANDDG